MPGLTITQDKSNNSTNINQTEEVTQPFHDKLKDVKNAQDVLKNVKNAQKDELKNVKNAPDELKKVKNADDELKNAMNAQKESKSTLENEGIVVAQQNNLKVLLNKKLQEKEEMLKNAYKEKIRLLKAERNLVEMSLQSKLISRLHEKDEAYRKVLEQQKLSLEKNMREKELEKNTLRCKLHAKDILLEKYKSEEEKQKQLESCVHALKMEIKEIEKEINQRKKYNKSSETDAKQAMMQTMQGELTCIICEELFIDATTLPCGHSFCEYCLLGHLKRTTTCPVCTCELKVKAFRSVVLDNAIEKMIDALGNDMRDRRLQLKKERDEVKRCEDAMEDDESEFIRGMVHQVEEDDGGEESESSTRHGCSEQGLVGNGNNNNAISSRGDYRAIRSSRSSRRGRIIRSSRNRHIHQRPRQINNNTSLVFNRNERNGNPPRGVFHQTQIQNEAQLVHRLTYNYIDNQQQQQQQYWLTNHIDNHHHHQRHLDMERSRYHSYCPYFTNNQ